MAKPFRFRYVSQIAGLFAGGAVLVVVTVVVLVGQSQRWFRAVDHEQVLLPEKGAFGLKAGCEVQMLGVVVGAVDEIEPPSEVTGRMRMRLHVDPHFARFIRGGPGDPGASRAVIHLPAVLGDPFVEFTRGQGRPPTPGTVYPADLETGTGDEIGKAVTDFRLNTQPAIQKLLDQYTLLAADLRNQGGPLQQTLVHVDRLAANLERTDSVLGKLTADKALAEELARAVGRLSASAEQLQATLANVRQTSAGMPAMGDQTRRTMAEVDRSVTDIRATTARLPALMASLQQTVDALPGVTAQTQQSLVEIERLVKGMQQLPLIRDHVDATAADAGTLRPSDVEAP